MHEFIVYAARRARLRTLVSSGIVVLIGNNDSPINYGDNVYPFRQDGTFQYFFGIDKPALAAVIDLDSAAVILFGDDPTEEDRIWLGESETLAKIGEQAGCADVCAYAKILDVVRQARRAGRKVHFLPPYREDIRVRLASLTDIPADQIHAHASTDLIRAVIALREKKDAEEIAEIEKALCITKEMHVVAMSATRPGEYERTVVAKMRAVLELHGVREAYAPIFTRNGQILHNSRYDNVLKSGDLVVNDFGASSLLSYASDVTRTLPVGGVFSPRQHELYEVLRQAQIDAISALRPGRPFVDVHLVAALRIVRGMRELGFFKGPVSDVVASGAYAICFPHGAGHQLGLDVHDMESLGEDEVGYGGEAERSQLFGLRNLRLAKPLREGMVITIEPGIYFIPMLIQRWKQQGHHREFINYGVFEEYLQFGGMRIEDDVLITNSGCRVLGPEIPKTPQQIEEAMLS
jgi:Xaa-Pro aminopeptidase/Xaa-Pro dipeptidase